MSTHQSHTESAQNAQTDFEPPGRARNPALFDGLCNR